MNPLKSIKARYSGLDEPLRSERRLEILCVLIAGVVLLQLLWLGVRQTFPPSIAAVAPAAEGLLAASPATALVPDAAQRLGLQARPLFWSSRRPEEAAAIVDFTEPDESDTAAVENPLPDLIVNGAFGGADVGGAIVTYRGKLRRLRLGDDLDGWTLTRVDDAELFFANAGVEAAYRIQTLPLAASAADAALRGAARTAPAAPDPDPGRDELQRPAGRPDQPRRLSAGGLPSSGVSASRNEE